MSGAFRWKARYTVLSILYMTWIVSLMDRMVISVAIPYISADFHLRPVASGAIISAFFAGYSITQIPGGLLADIFGVRKVATFAMLWWSVATAVTGAATNFAYLLIARLLFGLGEGVLPACGFKTVAVWFPQKERATATAVMIASNPLGAALAPLLVVSIMSFWGWRPVFFVMFIPGALMALLFWIYVTDSPSKSARVSPEELDEIEERDVANPKSLQRDVNAEAKISLLDVVRRPETLKYFLALFFLDITLSGFMTWLPTYLVKARGFSMMQMGVAASLPFFAGTAGSILGGVVSDKYFSQNRRLPVIISQVLTAAFLYMMFAASSLTMVVVWQTLVGALIMFCLSAFWALPMNTVPKDVMGVVGGFINMAGQLAALVSPILIGYLVEIAGGGFRLAFSLLIGAMIMSCGVILMLLGKSRPPGAPRGA
jgi:sugar phosphate permease